MNPVNRLEKEKFIFGTIFFLANKLQTVGDQYLGEADMTTRQWMLMVAIAQFGEQPPTLGEVADVLSNSHQNVKQLAMKLEKKGFISLEKDSKDRRITRLKLTEEMVAYWETREEKDNNYIKDLFKDLSEEEVNAMCTGLDKLAQRLFKMGEV